MVFHRHVVPDAGLEGIHVPGAVFLRSTDGSGQTLQVDEAVVRAPQRPVLVPSFRNILLDAGCQDAGHGRRDRCDDERHRVHLGARDAETAGTFDGAGRTLGEVVDRVAFLLVRIDLRLNDFDLHLMHDVVEPVVAVVVADLRGFGEGRTPVPAGDVLDFRHDAPLLGHQVDAAHERCIADHGIDAEQDIIEDFGAAFPEHGRQSGTVVDTGQRMGTVDQVAVAALEERGQFVCRGAGTFLFRTVDEEVRDLLDRGAAEGMTEDVDFLVGAFLTEVFQDTGVSAAVAGMAILLSMDFSVVDAASEQVGPEDTGSVPSGIPGTEGRVEHFEPLLLEMRNEVARRKEVPIRELTLRVDRIVFAPAVPAGKQHERIIVVILAHWTHLHSCVVVIIFSTTWL